MARRRRDDDRDAHILPVRVYYEDTDAAGFVYHANYLRFAERARTEMLRAVGIDQGKLRVGAGVTFVVKSCHIDYVAPARLDDVLHVHSVIAGISGARIHAGQTVTRDDETLAHLSLQIACVRADGRPTRLPSSVRTALSQYHHAGGKA